MRPVRVPQLPRRPEIDQLQFPVRHDHQVAGADVPVQHARGVDPRKHFHDRLKPAGDRLHTPGSALTDLLSERFRPEILHHDIGRPVLLEIIQNSDDRRLLRKLPQNPGLAQKTGPILLKAGQVCRGRGSDRKIFPCSLPSPHTDLPAEVFFDRDLSPGLQVHSLICNSEASLPDHADQPVASVQHRPGGKSQNIFRLFRASAPVRDCFDGKPRNTIHVIRASAHVRHRSCGKTRNTIRVFRASALDLLFFLLFRKKLCSGIFHFRPGLPACRLVQYSVMYPRTTSSAWVLHAVSIIVTEVTVLCMDSFRFCAGRS